MDSLSPESRALYEILMADTEEIYESKFAAYKKNKLDAVKQFVADTRMQVKDLQTTVDSVPGKVEIEVDPVKAALGEDLAAVKSALSSEISALAPATVVLASTPTLSTASMRAPSIPAVAPLDSASASTTSLHGLSSTKDGLTPEARRIYGYLVGGSAAPTSTTTLRVPSSSTTIAPTTPEARCLYNLLVGGSATQAPTTAEVSTVLPSPTEIEDVQDVVDIVVADLAASVPTTCSSECSSKNAPVSMTSIIPAACMMREGVPYIKVCTSNNTVSAASAASTDQRCYSEICDEQPCAQAAVASSDCDDFVSLTGSEALAAVSWRPCLFLEEDYTSTRDKCSSVSWGGLLGTCLVSKDACKFCSSVHPEHLSHLDMQFITWYAQYKWLPMPLFGHCLVFRFGCIPTGTVFVYLPLLPYVERNPWPPPSSNRSTSCRIFNLRDTLYSVQLSGDLQVLKTVEFTWNASLIVVIFVPGGQIAQLKPTIFKWPDPFCFDTHLLIAGRSDLFLAHMVWNLCCLDTLHCLLGSINRAIPNWGLHISFPATGVLVNCDFARVDFQWAITVQKWNSRQGNTHYSQLIEWSSQSEFGFCTLGNILFCYCVLVQWEIPWTISMILLKSGFQCCSAGHESLYNGANFQWTIAWFLSYHFSLSSLQTRPHCAIPFVQLNRPAIYQEIRFRFMTTKLTSAAIIVTFLENHCAAYVELSLVNCAQQYTSDNSQWEIAWLLVWPSVAGSDFICSGIDIVTFRLHFKLGILPPLHCRDLIFWRYPSVYQMMKNSGHIIRCGFELRQWKIAWLFLWEYLDVGNQPKHFIPAATQTYQVWYSSWDPGILGLLRFCGGFAQGVAKGRIMVEASTYCYYHYVDVFLGETSSAMSTSSTLCKSTSTASTTSATITTMACIMETSQVPWDPGGLTWHRLGVKPIFMEGGLSTTGLHELRDGPPLGPWPAWEPHAGEKDKHIYQQSGHNGMGTWNRTERRLRPRLG